MKKAVVFYSLTGNTREAAEYVAKELGADIFEIALVKPLPENQGKRMMIGGMQAVFGARPGINGVPAEIANYDEIVLGVPIWASKAASPINTLIKKYEIADKVIAVFTFSGGGDNDKCLASLTRDLRNLKSQVALADRSNPIASENSSKLKRFVEGLA